MHDRSAPQPRPVLAVFLKLLSVVLLASMAACVKYLGESLPVGQIIFARGLISLPVLALIAWQIAGLHLLATRNPRTHALRSLSGTISMFCWFYALTLIPLAEFTAISFTAPMFLTLLAMLFLGERIHVYRWTALMIGMTGVLIVTAPHFGVSAASGTAGDAGAASIVAAGSTLTSGSSVGVLVALAAAVFAALAMMFLRSMSGAGREHAVTIAFYFTLTSTVCALFTLSHGWLLPDAGDWLFIALIGLFGVGGQLLMTYSYRYAEASTIAPLDYASLILAVTYGYVFFGEIPGWSIWLGAPLVIVAGLIILWREYRSARTGPASVTVADG